MLRGIVMYRTLGEAIYLSLDQFASQASFPSRLVT